jgi:virulence factor Mce-like protein
MPMTQRTRSARVLAIAALVGGCSVLALALSNGGAAATHSVAVIERDAPDLLAGDWVMAAGQRVGNVGAISPVEGGRAVKIVFDLGGSAWPLPRGSRFDLRWGGSASFFNRYVELTMGPHGEPPIPNGSMIPAGDFSAPAELDTVTSVFSPTVRRATTELIDRGGVAFRAASAPLRAALIAAPPALHQASKVLQDLQDSNTDLNQLLRSTDQVVNTVQTADPGIGQLLSGAGTTFAAVAAKDSQLVTAIDRVPGALIQTRTTLASANGTLTAADQLLRRLSPGINTVRAIATPLDDVLGSVTHVGPRVAATLTTARNATPRLNPLLTLATTLMPEIGSIGRQATTALQCIRPYSPDIAGFANNWGDFLSWSDGKDRVIRATIQNIVAAPVNGLPYNSATAAKLFPGLTYAFPRPPGDAAGEPWFLPQCGITPNALNPAHDPEAAGAG